METATLQDWLTVSGKGDGASLQRIAQGQPFWLDVGEFRDAIAWLQVTETSVSGLDTTVQLTYQTAPTMDEALFTTVGGPVIASPGVTVTQMLGSVANPPLGRYLRWMVTTAAVTNSTWDLTFRVLVALNRPGYRTPRSLSRGTILDSAPNAFSPNVSTSTNALAPAQQSAFGHRPFSIKSP